MLVLKIYNTTAGLNFLIIFIILCVNVGVLPACISVYHVHVWYLRRPERGIGSGGTRVMNGCEP